MELTTSLVQAALLADAGITIDYEKIAKNVPSASTLKDLVIDAATDATFDTVEDIVDEGARIFLMCDKGAKKTSNAHFVKLLCWWSKSEKNGKDVQLRRKRHRRDEREMCKGDTACPCQDVWY